MGSLVFIFAVVILTAFLDWRASRRWRQVNTHVERSLISCQAVATRRSAAQNGLRVVDGGRNGVERRP